MGHFPPVRLGSLRERIYLYISSYEEIRRTDDTVGWWRFGNG